jgi:hypothetical protein
VLARALRRLGSTPWKNAFPTVLFLEQKNNMMTDRSLKAKTLHQSRRGAYRKVWVF